MPCCSFIKCTNHSGKEKKSTGITFHTFPKDASWRQKWLKIVRKQRRELDWVATSNSRVCSLHFKPDDIYVTKKGLNRIKKGAVPFIQVISNYIELQKKKLSVDNKNMKVKYKRETKKIISLKETLLKHKKKLNITEDQFTELKTRAEVVDLYKRMRKRNECNKISRIKFIPSVKKFALTFNFYSPAGYKYVRKVFRDCLPHPRTLGEWYENTDAAPGFTAQSFDVLKKKHTLSGKRILCTLIVDEMAIRQQSVWNGKKTLGLVNHGAGSLDMDQIASQAFVMMLVCLNQNWKLPVGYFFPQWVNC